MRWLVKLLSLAFEGSKMLPSISNIVGVDLIPASDERGGFNGWLDSVSYP